MKPAPLPLREIPVERCQALATLFTDIDDTLTSDGLLPASTFQALWALTEAGVRIVLVVDPVSRTVHVHSSPQDVRLLRETDQLEVGDIVPGWRVTVADLFP